ncbi:ATP-binding protein [Actinomadura rupiterrae]|uniref:ATP-binding protein n=1 Tax=Actinomadura rupiterrae TaxID=559627 RepID=UPI0020A3CC65|nr:ATP-binding protein [Actinomadura rupiterrae]MCP2336916.1 signal transduction histidine kinase [Actinomadura rupiterrae]
MSPSAPAPDPSLSPRPLWYALWTSAGATLALTAAGPWLFAAGAPARWPGFALAVAAALGTVVLAVLTMLRASAWQTRLARRATSLAAERTTLISERDALTADRVRLHEQWRQYAATLTDANGLLRKGVEHLLTDALPAALADRDAPLPPPEQDEALGADLTDLRARTLQDLRTTARAAELSRITAESDARAARRAAEEAADAAQAKADETIQAANLQADERVRAAQEAAQAETDERVRTSQAEADERVRASQAEADERVRAVQEAADKRLAEAREAADERLAEAREAARAAESALAGVTEDADGRLDSQRMVLVALGRRQQTLMHRVQAAAERLAESRRDDPEVYAAGQTVDHLAAQAARLAQSLVVACGTWEGQHWPDPMRLAETVQAATARIEDFRRVRIEGDPLVAVRPAVLEPVIHLLAELLDNATTLSPSATDVIVGLSAGASGAVVRIDDQGTGLEEPRLSEAQALVSGERPVDLTELGEVPRLGLVVVGRYARRHNLHLALEPSPYGGLRVVVRIPDGLTTTVRPPAFEPVAPEPPREEPRPAPEPAPTVVEAAAAPVPDAEEASDGLPKRTSRRRSEARPSGPLSELAPPPSSPDEAGAFIASLFTTPTPGTDPAPNAEASASDKRAPDLEATPGTEPATGAEATPGGEAASGVEAGAGAGGASGGGGLGTSAAVNDMPSQGDDLDR